MRPRKKTKKARKPSKDMELVLDRRVPTAVKGNGVVRGTVRYPWGTVKHATVSVGEKSVLSDSSGQYEIADLLPGSYTVSVKVPFPGYDAQPQKVEIADGETKIVDAKLDFKKTVVEGHVLDEEGTPIANATVSGVYCGKDTETARTDEKGYFKFDRASPGNQFIRVNAPAYFGETRDFRANEGEATALELRLKKGTCKILGVVKGEGGQPLQANVTLSSSSGVILEKATSDANTGKYEFVVSHGTYNLLATSAGYDSKGWRGSVSDTTELNLELTKSRALRLDRIPQDLGESSYDDRSPW